MGGGGGAGEWGGEGGRGTGFYFPSWFHLSRLRFLARLSANPYPFSEDADPYL
jgi:hypothetical protein